MNKKNKISLGFSSSEQRGIYFILLLLIVCCLYQQNAKDLFTKPLNQAPLKLDSLLNKVGDENLVLKEKQTSSTFTHSKMNKSQNSYKNYIKSTEEKTMPITKEAPIKLTALNPNLATEQELQRWPISSFIKKNILKYRAAGGKFNEVEDLKKIYGMDEESYERIKHLILIPKEESNVPRKSKNKNEFQWNNKRKEIEIDINVANASTFAQLSGIGPVLSERIIKYRNRLGGFHSIEQIASTYGLQDSVYQKIKHQLVLNQRPINKIHLNQCDTKALSSHPYISYRLAKTIINYRKQHGPFQSLNDLLNIKIMDSLLLNKIQPYLTIDLSIEKEEIITQVEP